MAGRGVHRGVYSSLLDHPDFQALSPPARHVLLTARLSKQAGPAAIFVCYREVLARQTGLRPRRVEEALDELARRGWIRREGVVVWIVNGLKYDPTMRLNNPKHRAAVRRALEELPRTGIVVSYFQHYNLEWLSDSLSDSHSNAYPELGSPNTEEDRGTSPKNTEVHPEDRTPPNPLTGGSHAPEPAHDILDFLNRKTGHRFRPATSTLGLIRARLSSGATADQIRSVIVAKWREWRDRPDMVGFLRPATLFRASNFESYLGQLPAEVREER